MNWLLGFDWLDAPDAGQFLQRIHLLIYTGVVDVAQLFKVMMNLIVLFDFTF